MVEPKDDASKPVAAPKPLPPPPIDCTYIHGDVELSAVLTACKDFHALRGDGYLILDGEKEYDIHKFFKNKTAFFMGIRIFAHPHNPHIVDLGTLERVGTPDPAKLGIWIENTEVRKVIAKRLSIVHGVRIKGNKHMESQTLDFFQGKISDNSTVPVNVSSLIVNKIRYKRIQAPGECNFDAYNNNPPNFTDCKILNNLILVDNQRIPPSFNPTNITGCIVVQFGNSDHDWMKKVDLKEVSSFECSRFGLEAARTKEITLAINRNSKVCLREDTPLLAISQVATLRNGNPDCDWHCQEWEISTRGQRFCQSLDGDLIIDNRLANDVNITEITMSLKEIRGSIVISGLTLLPASAGVNVIDFRALEKLTGGDTYRESVIIVENSTISDILFENIKTIHGFRNALEVNEWNPNFNMSEETIFLLNIAANGKNIIIKEYKSGNETEEKEEETTEEEESDNIGLIIGLTIGGMVLVAIVAALIPIALFIVKKKKKNQLKQKKKKTTKNVDKEKSEGEYIRLESIVEKPKEEVNSAAIPPEGQNPPTEPTQRSTEKSPLLSQKNE